MQKLKELIKLSNLCNFQLFASSIEKGNIRHQKLRNYWVAKKLMSRTSPVKFRVFRREFLRNHSMNWTQIFRENLNCYALSIFRVFILLASSDSDRHMLMRQKGQRFAYRDLPRRWITYTYFKKRCRRERRVAVVERKFHDWKELWFP